MVISTGLSVFTIYTVVYLKNTAETVTCRETVLRHKCNSTSNGVHIDNSLKRKLCWKPTFVSFVSID